MPEPRLRRGLGPRLAAFKILRRVARGQLFDMARDRELAGLDERDRGLAHEISAGVLRSRSKLDRQIVQLLSRPWQDVSVELRDVLRIGAYQLLSLDRVPRHAAVGVTVELAKAVVGKRASTLVNAVLRRVERMEVDLAGLTTVDDFAVEYSHPPWLVQRWFSAFGPERTRALMSHNNTAPPVTILPMTGRQKLSEELDRAGVEWTDAPFGAGMCVSGVGVTEIPGFSEGGFIVQDSAQTKVIEFCDLPSSGRVWDCCAAPGGKSAVIGRQVESLVSSDLTAPRMRLLRETLGRAGETVSGLVRADSKVPPFARHTFAAVVIDAPCSATGTIRKHPDARWRLSQSAITGATRVQRTLLESAATTVQPGGILVYSTCSLEPEENANLVDEFVGSNPAFERTRDDLSIFPPDHGTDGAFAARLIKDG